MITAKDEQRIRRAVRYFVEYSRAHVDNREIQYAFDLLIYIRPDARGVVEDETVHALADLIGGD